LQQSGEEWARVGVAIRGGNHLIYGYRARAVWKRFVGPEDCLAEYERWAGEGR